MILYNRYTYLKFTDDDGVISIYKIDTLYNMETCLYISDNPNFKISNRWYQSPEPSDNNIKISKEEAFLEMI